MSRTRWVLLDNTDPTIDYDSRGWFPVQNTFENAGGSGPVYRGSQHVTYESASLRFQFNGTRIRLLGSSVINNSSGVPDPSWECFVDGQSIGSEDPFPSHQNNWPLCLAPDSLDDGEHVLTLNVTTKGNPFYFDQIKYLPSPHVDRQPTNATVVIEQSDPVVRSIKGAWTPVNGSALSTVETGATLEMDFVGTRLSFVGWTLAGNTRGTSGFYVLDGGADISFQIPGPKNDSGSQFFQTLFETQPLDYGSHNIKVSYDGGGRNPTPLTLDYFLVENGEIGDGAPTVDDEPQPSNFASQPTNGPTPALSKPPIGAIAGGVGGGVALIALFIFVLLLIRKRMRSNLAPLPFPSFRQFQHRPPDARYPRQSFSEAMVRKPSTSRSTTTASLNSVQANYTYASVYSTQSGYSAKDSAFVSSETDLYTQPPMSATKLTPLRRNMVIAQTIPE